MSDKEKLIALLDAFGVMDWRDYHGTHIVKTTQEPAMRYVFDPVTGDLVRVGRMRRGQWRTEGVAE